MPEPQGWATQPLSAVISSLDAGVSVNAEDRPHAAGEVGVLKTSALSGGVFRPEQNKAVLAKERGRVAEPVISDSILLSRMNTPALVGESCYVEEDWPTLFVPDRIWQLKPRSRESLSMRWLAHVLRSTSARAHIETHATGTSGSMKNLPKRRLMALQVHFPPFQEQRVIAEVLDTLDTTIRQTESIIEKLKQVKQGLLHDLLTRGIDANGELRPPQSQAPHLYKESALGWIPSDWNMAPLGELAQVDRGKFTHRPRNDPAFYGGPHPFIQTGDVANAVGGYVSSYSQTLSERGTTVSQEFPAGTVAITIAANIADTAILAVPMYFPDSVVGAIVAPSVNSRFIELSVRRAKPRLDARAPQSAQKNINLQDLRPLPIPLPSKAEQDAIAERYEAVQLRLDTEEAAARKLREAKCGLMDDLLTGRVRVTSLLDTAATA